MKDEITAHAKRMGLASLRWANRTEGRYTVAGLGGGTVAGVFVGGMGLAVGGTAVALSGPIVIGAGCALVANRIGMEMERRKLKKAARAESGSEKFTEPA